MFGLYKEEDKNQTNANCFTWPILKEKGRDLTYSYEKSPYINRHVKKAKWQHKNATIMLEYTAIVDWLRTVSWSD